MILKICIPIKCFMMSQHSYKTLIFVALFKTKINEIWLLLNWMYLFIDEWSARLKKWAQKYHKTPLKFIFVSSLLRWETRLCRLEHFKVSLLNSKKCNTFSLPQAIKKCEFKHHKVRQHDTWRRFWQRRDCWCRINWFFIAAISLFTRKLLLCFHWIND